MRRSITSSIRDCLWKLTHRIRRLTQLLPLDKGMSGFLPNNNGEHRKLSTEKSWCLNRNGVDSIQPTTKLYRALTKTQQPKPHLHVSAPKSNSRAQQTPHDPIPERLQNHPKNLRNPRN